MLCRDGDFAKAIKNYESAIVLEPKNPKFYQALHRIYTKLGNFDKAKEAWKELKNNYPIQKSCKIVGCLITWTLFSG